MADVTFPFKKQAEGAFIIARNEDGFNLYGRADEKLLTRKELEEIKDIIDEALADVKPAVKAREAEQKELEKQQNLKEPVKDPTNKAATPPKSPEPKQSASDKDKDDGKDTGKAPNKPAAALKSDSGKESHPESKTPQKGTDLTVPKRAEVRRPAPAKASDSSSKSKK